jgi:hypothetical protein
MPSTIRMAKRIPYLLLVAAALLSVGACNRRSGQQEEQPLAVDRVVRSGPKPPAHFLHRTFPVKTYQPFEFTVPPHSFNARLQGNFHAFIIGSGGSNVSDENANVEVLLLNEQEFDDFSHGRQGTATYSVDAGYNQIVECALPATQDEPKKFYLVFRNPRGGAKGKFVDADFTASFE